MKRTILTVIVTAIIAAASTVTYIGSNTNYIDMSTVKDIDVTESGVMLYLSDGSGYYLEQSINTDVMPILINNIAYWEVTDEGLALYDYDGNSYQWN